MRATGPSILNALSFVRKSFIGCVCVCVCVP